MRSNLLEKISRSCCCFFHQLKTPCHSSKFEALPQNDGCFPMWLFPKIVRFPPKSSMLTCVIHVDFCPPCCHGPVFSLQASNRHLLTLWTQLDRMCQGKALDHPPLQHLERPKSSVIGWVSWLVGWVCVVVFLSLLSLLKVCCFAGFFFGGA